MKWIVARIRAWRADSQKAMEVQRMARRKKDLAKTLLSVSVENFTHGHRQESEW